jgi:hypothetical protein
MISLLPQITCAISDRFHDDSGTAGCPYGRGQRLKRVEVPPVAGHQKDWTRICLRDRLNGPDRDADDGNHCNRHGQQQDKTAGTDYQAASLG